MKHHTAAAWTFCSVSSLVAAAFAFSSAGCNSSSVEPPKVSAEIPVTKTPAPAPPEQEDRQPEIQPEVEEIAEAPEPIVLPGTEELLETIRSALTESSAGFTEGGVQHQDIEAGLDAAEDLILRNTQPETAEAAWHAKLKLLYYGARTGSEDYSDQLAAASRAVAETPFTRQAEYGNALCADIQCLQPDLPVYAIADTLSKHHRWFPDGFYSARLFLVYARKFAQADRRDDAIAVCRSAMWNLHGHHEIEHVRSFLHQLEHRTFTEQPEAQPDTPREMILRQVSENQASLPIQVDDYTILHEIEAADQMVIYSYTVTLEAEEFDDAVEEIEETVNRNARENPTTLKMLEAGIQLRYDYYSQYDELLGSLTVDPF